MSQRQPKPTPRKNGKPKPVGSPPVAKPTRLQATPTAIPNAPAWKQIPWQAYALGGFVLIAGLIYMNRPARRSVAPPVATASSVTPPAPRPQVVYVPQSPPVERVSAPFRSVEMSRAVPPVAVIEEPEQIVSTLVPEQPVGSNLSDWDALVGWKLPGFAQTPGEPAVDAILHVKRVDIPQRGIALLLELPQQPLLNQPYQGTFGATANKVTLKNNGNRYAKTPNLGFLTARTITLTWTGRQLSGAG
ncbi:MAG: hypothetical protein KDA66_11700, partial [Planctomycetaceae bacterium]|nr:hypothetical protein [Planctomycetaceae bacterium]